MQRNGGLGRIFYKPESGPNKTYRQAYREWFDGQYWHSERIAFGPAYRREIKRRQRKKSRQWGKRNWEDERRFPLT